MDTETLSDHDTIREKASRLPRHERDRLEGFALDQVADARVARIVPFPPGHHARRYSHHRRRYRLRITVELIVGLIALVAFWWLLAWWLLPHR